MRRKLLLTLLLSCAFLMGNTVMAESVLAYLRVTANGTETSYDLEQMTGVSFEDDNLVLSFVESADVRVPLDNVEKLTFTAEPTGVGTLTIRQQGVRLVGSTLYVDAQEAAVVSIYTLDGRLVRQQVAHSGRPVALNGIQAGAYVVKVNGESTKILKK